MRSYLTSVLLFVLFAIPAYVAVIVLAGTISPFSQHRNIKYARGGYGHLYNRLQDADTTGQVDILFLGSSHAYRGFDPRIFSKAGYTSFNLGSSSQTPVQTKILYERYIDRFKPKLIIFDVYPNTFNTEGVESFLNLLSNAPLDRHLMMAALDSRHATVWNTAIFSAWRILIGANIGFTEPLFRATDKDLYVPGGYVEKSGKDFKPTTSRVHFKWSPPSNQWQAFNHVLAASKTKGIPVILVHTPVTAPYQYLPEDRMELDRQLRPLAAAYLDLSDALRGDEAEFFYDGHHMNQHGVERFNALFLDSLAARGLLPPH